MGEWGVRRSGVNVPGIRMVDAASGVLGIEWIEGRSVRFLLGGGAEDEQEMEVIEGGDDDDIDDDGNAEVEDDPLLEYGVSKGASASSALFFRGEGIDLRTF